MTAHVATAETEIDASVEAVWRALTEPELIARYMFGSHVETDWQVGSSIRWKGEYEGKPYEDRGEVLAIEPERKLELTHYSPLGGAEDLPENYHTLTYLLEADGPRTRMSLSQDNNGSEEEAQHSQAMWERVLDGLKKVAEEG